MLVSCDWLTVKVHNENERYIIKIIENTFWYTELPLAMKLKTACIHDFILPVSHTNIRSAMS